MMNNLNTSTTFIPTKTVISETMIHSVITSIAEIKINRLDNGDFNNIDIENNIDNVELSYNFKLRQSVHLIEKYGKSSPYANQFIQQSNTNIFQRKFKHVDIRTKNITLQLNITYVINSINI